MLLGALLVCRRVNFVRENVFCLSPGDGEIQTNEQLGQGFTFSPHEHGQGVFPLVRYSDTFRYRRNNPDADSAHLDKFIDVRQVWEITRGNVGTGAFV